MPQSTEGISVAAAIAPAVTGAAIGLSTQNLFLAMIGGLMGSLLSVSVFAPRTYRMALNRMLSGIMCGVVFGPWGAAYFFTEPTGHDLLGAGAVCGFLGWFTFGMFARTMSRWDTVEDAGDTVSRVRENLESLREKNR